MNNRKRAILLVAAVAAVFLIAGGVYLALSGMENRVYMRQLKKAEDYARNKDYENAILIYQELINQSPKQPDAYQGLSNVYAEQGDIEMAAMQLELGAGRTGDANLSIMLNRLLDASDSSRADGIRTDRKAEGIRIPMINEDLFALFGRGSYRDYAGKYQVNPEKETGSGSASVTVNGDGFVATLYFVDGVVSDSAIPSEIVLQNALRLFSYENDLTYEELENLNLENLQAEKREDGKIWITFDYKDLEAEVECNESGAIDSDSEARLTPKHKAAEAKGMIQTLSGSITDAQDASGVSDAVLTFTSLDDRSAPPYRCLGTTDGSYSLELPEGNYELTVDADGYTTYETDVYVSGYSNGMTQDFILSKESEGEIRIVLTWGSYPSDLDSYLEGTTDRNEEVFINYNNKENYGAGELLAELDLDDTDGDGPETTTLYHTKGHYKFSVFDYNLTKKIGESGASVTVYFPDGGQETFTLDYEEGENTLWEVFELHDGELTVIDRVSYVVGSYDNKW